MLSLHECIIFDIPQLDLQRTKVSNMWQYSFEDIEDYDKAIMCAYMSFKLFHTFDGKF